MGTGQANARAQVRRTPSPSAGPPPVESRGGPTTIQPRVRAIRFPGSALAFDGRALVEQLVDAPGARFAAFFLADQAANRS